MGRIGKVASEEADISIRTAKREVRRDAGIKGAYRRALISA